MPTYQVISVDYKHGKHVIETFDSTHEVKKYLVSNIIKNKKMDEDYDGDSDDEDDQYDSMVNEMILTDLVTLAIHIGEKLIQSQCGIIAVIRGANL